MFARRYIVGHFGIRRQSTRGEKPLSTEDIERLKSFFKEVRVSYPEMHLWRLVPRIFTIPVLRSMPQGLNNWIYDLFALWDNATYALLPRLRRFSWYVYIECIK
jgi:hypothetical protein